MDTTMSETIDPELWAMRFMSVDELDRFANILETIEKEHAWFNAFKESATPDGPLTDRERSDFIEHMSTERGAMSERSEMIGKYTNQVHAWEKLVTYSLTAIESLFEKGKLDQVDDLNQFWQLVYYRVLIDRGSEIGRDPSFRNVKILEVQKELLTERLPGFAERFRERGNPILAIMLEELASTGNQF
jgi:gamma-glutamylcysteine synthetase